MTITLFAQKSACWCERCHKGELFRGMIVCPDCGNKRCLKAKWHGFVCTGSNEVNQPDPPAWIAEALDEAIAEDKAEADKERT